ncbi:hypothetical protein V2A60_002494 [Cordyceps javanica]|uniref:Uncharacterized protein n=1 Tax=Cordyceps javanica TaxID=43265 RepID=A0A545UMY1_9HYPO|nr:hypothetical protein IF1G_10556 [Cordyceps javanica]TQW02449.1 hypothetical protein IF2G_10049 [Cordyceps javanica]
MSSITTQIPTGILDSWCLGDAWGFDGLPTLCGNDTHAPHDFWTVCCDGDIVNVKTNIWNGPNMTMEELICCRHRGSLEGGLHPLPTGPPWTCDLGAAGTPLASLAATNTDNAGAFVATYASANEAEGPTPTDLLLTETPQCLWVLTEARSAMTQVTVDAASIVSLSTTTFWGTGPVETATAASSSSWPDKSSTTGQHTTEAGEETFSVTTAPSLSSTQHTAPSTSSSVTNLGQLSLFRTILMYFFAMSFFRKLWR